MLNKYNFLNIIRVQNHLSESATSIPAKLDHEKIIILSNKTLNLS